MAAEHASARSPSLIGKGDSVLLVIDAQDRLVAAMDAGPEAVRRIGILVQAAKTLDVPVLATEQYPKGLGHTVPELMGPLSDVSISEKTEFGAGEIESVRTSLERMGRRQLLLTGFEAHVCVLQSAATLAQLGYEVFVAADAVSSRNPADKACALDRLRGAGITVVTTEMVVFEWLGGAGVPGFKELSRLIR